MSCIGADNAIPIAGSFTGAMQYTDTYMFGIGTKEIIIIAVVLVLLFGARKIPDLARGIADAIRTLRQGFSDDVSKDK